uniref:EF0012 n=2 Tax=Bacteria TaxID=2 RepID=Q8KUD0_ENTFL|nr:EF0012 [Enterococcus faecalis]
MNQNLLEKTPKNNKLRYAEYYGMIEIYDELFNKSNEGKIFKNLMGIIISTDNILLAYRTIKRNGGSTTKGIDGVTVKDIEKLSQSEFIGKVRNRFNFYKPRKVRRVEIPKPNGKTRPLGIPSIWDRIAQQCILQVLEPICEAKFNKHSYGFRPLRSTDNAIADCLSNQLKVICHIVGRILIFKDFSMQGNHVKTNADKFRPFRNSRIKKLFLFLTGKCLKAPFGFTRTALFLKFPTKGTPQGGILSPLLSNICLNEFDWWIARQWEERECSELVPQFNSKGTRHKSHDYRKLRSSTTLKQVYIVRYADDFKLFCKIDRRLKDSSGATKMWLKERLRLPISEEKSKVTNLKKKSSEFLGITLKMVKKNHRFVCYSHVALKARKRIKRQLKDQIKRIQRKKSKITTIREIQKYNSMVIGIHNYYNVATHVSKDFESIGSQLHRSFYNRFRNKGLTKKGNYKGHDKGIQPYMESKRIQYLVNFPPFLPNRIWKNQNPSKGRKKTLNKYTALKVGNLYTKINNPVAEWKVQWLREHPIINERATIEYNDNRISLFIAQKGKCAITGNELFLDDMHCHHKKLWSESKDDSYKNLILLSKEMHKLVHCTDEVKIREYIYWNKLSDSQVNKVNKLRKLVNKTIILPLCEQMPKYEQLTLF